MRRNAFKEDLYFLYNTLLKHPFFLMDAEAVSNFTQFYQSKADEVYSYDSLINAATELTGWFQDGHTNIEVPYTEQDRCIPLHCGWDERGCCLVLSEKYEGFPAGTQIMAVNGMTVDDLISYMAERISHENIYLVKSRMIAYPYQNYHLFSERNLKDLFGSQEEYTISFLINDEVVEKQCCLVKYNGFLDFADERDFINYEIQDNQMILHLNACIYNEKYKRTLATVAQLCKESGVTSFILDLSQNMGGNSAVLTNLLPILMRKITEDMR